MRFVGRRTRCVISLLPERANGLEENIRVRGPEGLEDWNALQEEWYADITPDGLGRILRAGAQWEAADETGIHWVLPRDRDIYVLAARPERGVYGFVSTTRLLLNEDQVVLCTSEQEAAVRRELAAAGCPEPSLLDERNGVPAGWRLFTDVRPTTAVPHDAADGILNVLRPLHEVDIELSGGIRIERMKWLCGHPPQIRLRGEHDSLEVVIDQQIAARHENNTYTVPGWDDLGVHRVFCGGNTAAYEIIIAPSAWKAFPAMSYKRTGAAELTFTVCGPLVKAISDDDDTVLLSATTGVYLLGAEPGQIAFAAAPSDVRVPAFLGAAKFHAVWAVPAAPLQSDRNTASVQLIHQRSPEPVKTGKNGRSLRLWAYSIMDASYKRLRIEPSTAETRALWAQYKLAARRIKRQSR